MPKENRIMFIQIKDFLKNAYYYIKQTLDEDIFTKVKTKNGNVIIMSEEKFECLLDLLKK